MKIAFVTLLSICVSAFILPLESKPSYSTYYPDIQVNNSIIINYLFILRLILNKNIVDCT